MNAVIMDEADIGEEAFVGACAFVPAGMHISPRVLVVGTPAKIVRPLADDEVMWKHRGTLIRRPCVTVNYMRGDEVDYHVDLAIYVKRDDGLLDLAKGKLNSSPEKRVEVTESGLDWG